MGFASNFRELEVYKVSKYLSDEVYSISKQFPREEMFSLTDQIRRSSRSVGAQIAEAWGKRPYPKHFISKLTDADGEQLETQHWIEVAKACNYITEEQTKILLTKCESVGKMLHAMMSKADQFCVIRQKN